MRINSINNGVSFQKTPIASCVVKNVDNKKVDATLYLMDAKSYGDYEEIKNSSCSPFIKANFEKAHYCAYPPNFYILKNNNDDSVVSAVQTSCHYAQNGRMAGEVYTLVDEVYEDTNYVDALVPLFAQTAQDAKNNRSASVVVCDDFLTKEIRSAKFKQDKTTGAWYLSQKDYSNLQDAAQTRNNMTYLA